MVAPVTLKPGLADGVPDINIVSPEPEVTVSSLRSLLVTISNVVEPLDVPAGIVILSELLSTAKSYSELSVDFIVAVPLAIVTPTVVDELSKLNSPKEAVISILFSSLSSLIVVSLFVVAVSVSTLNAIALTTSLSELIVMVSPVTDNPERVVLPDTVMVSGVTSTTLSSVIVKLKVPDPVFWPAGIITSKLSTVVKSAASALPMVPFPSTITVMVVFDPKSLDPVGRLAVTFTSTVASPSPIVS